MIYIFGHKNPDTDSVMSAIALSNLKNRLGYSTIPCVLGSINKESKYVLEYFNIDEPILLNNVKTQIKDLNYDKVKSITIDKSILHAYKLMEEENIKVLPVVTDENKLIGIITMKDIAMGLIKGDFYNIKTDIKTIIKDLNGKILVSNDNYIEGSVSVLSYYKETLVNSEAISENSIVIVGDRYDIIEYAIDCKVRLIIITGGREIPLRLIEKAKEKKVNIVLVNQDTYTTSKLITQCNYVSKIIKDKDIIKFEENEYLEDVKEELINNRYFVYPVVNNENEILGFINRGHLLKPNKKEVILVDHNEYSQSVEGLKEANILEIIDHHKIGDISTYDPIKFINYPVGSTCTIVYLMYKENNIEIDQKIAGCLISGIISDTLFLKSPTTTSMDKKAIEELNKITKLDLKEYSMKMFRVGTSLEGQSIEEIFFKDFKEFIINKHKIGIGQVFTLDIDDIMNRKDEFIDFINKEHNKKEYLTTLILITDIIKNGSYILYASNNEILKNTFLINPYQGMFLEGIVSRKKQVIPKLIEGIKM